MADGKYPPRNFIADFLMPAIVGLAPQDRERVAIALDAAIAFGVLEAANGNESMTPLRLVEAKYWQNVSRLKDSTK